MASIKSRYRSLPLIDLIKEIVDGDLDALLEFHNNRPVFSYNNGPSLVLVEYLTELRESVIRGGSTSANALEAAERTYDLTLEKFNNLPSPPKPEHFANKKNDDKLKRKGPDCRLYYRAYLEKCAKSFDKKPSEGELEKEILAGKIMQGLVKRQFYYSLLEAERGLNRFRSRYNWNINGGNLTIYLPVLIKGLERRKWLEENIENPDPFKEGERERIQAIINLSFVDHRMVQLKDAQNIADKKQSSSHWPGDGSEPSLSEVVAEKKADNIEKQRPAIKALGKDKLKQLILCVFDEIRDTDYSDGKLAQDFGLSKGTLSRFAGSHWHKSGRNTLPDLWRNTAKILSENRDFEEMATGFKKQIHNTLERDRRHKLERTK